MSQDQVYEALGLTGATDEAKQRIIENILATVELRFAEVVDDILTDEQAEAFSRVVEQGDYDANIVWLQENVPQAADLYGAVLTDIVSDMQAQAA